MEDRRTKVCSCLVVSLNPSNNNLFWPLFSFPQVNELATAAQLIQHDKNDKTAIQKAAEFLHQAEEEANNLVQDVEAEIALHDEKGEVLRKEAATLRASRNKLSEVNSADKGKGKGRATEYSSEDGSEDEDPINDEGLPKTPAGKEHVHKKTGLVNRLRDCYLSSHRVKFLQGDLYHVMGEQKSVDEEAAYSAAEALRKQLLKRQLLSSLCRAMSRLKLTTFATVTEVSATRAMAQLKLDVTTSWNRQGVNLERLLVPLPYCPKGGIRSADLVCTTPPFPP